MILRRYLLTGSATAATLTLAGCSSLLSEDEGSDGAEAPGDGTSPDNQDSLTDGEQNLIGTYEAGLGEINSGEESLEAGSSWTEEERYVKAIEEYRSAADSFRLAEGRLQTAEDIAPDGVGAEVISIIRTAREYASYRKEQAYEINNAVDDELINAPAEKIEAHRDAAEEARQKADQIDPKTPEEFRAAVESS